MSSVPQRTMHHVFLVVSVGRGIRLNILSRRFVLLWLGQEVRKGVPVRFFGTAF